jgi:hypothetical protein
MRQHALLPPFGSEAEATSDREYDRLYRNLGFVDDPIVGAAYAISEWAISLLGPVLWISLIYLLLVAEFGR